MHTSLKHSFLVPIAALLLQLIATGVSAQWQQTFGPRGEDVQSLASDFTGHLYAGTDSGVFVSSDSGRNWTLSTTGLGELEIFSIGISKSESVVVGTEGGGCYRSKDFCNTWESINTGLYDTLNVLSVIGDRSGDLVCGSAASGTFISTDEGDHWLERSDGLANQSIWSLTAAPNGTLYAGATGFISKSTDLGIHWTNVDTLQPKEEVLALASDSNGHIFAGTTRGSVLRSTDNGTTWTVLPSGLTRVVECIATNGSSVFVGTYGQGIWVSSDNGMSWTQPDTGLTDSSIYSMTVAPDRHLYAGTFQAMVFRTVDPLPLEVGKIQQSYVDLLVQPNPFETHATVKMVGFSNEQVRLSLYDITGREVPNALTPAQSDRSQLDASKLTSGMYMLVAKTSGGILTRPILCVR